MSAAVLPVTDLAEARQAATRAALLARIRANVPERREKVIYGAGIVWRQDITHVAIVLAARAAADLVDDEAGGRHSA